jgi:hypothetical protein
VRGTQLSWLGKAELEGMKKGLEKGRVQGEKQSAARMRRAVLQLLKGKFGPVPQSVRQRLRAMDSIEPLAQVIERVPLARSIEDLGLG